MSVDDTHYQIYMGVVAARSRPGPGSARARPLGVVRFGPDTLHDMRSVTKSIVGRLYGVALEQGRIPRPEEELLEQF
jgi:CubicO group peptidase (beta-lactamase class C family)